MSAEGSGVNCPICGTRLRKGVCPQERLAAIERPNPARYLYGHWVDRKAIDAHLRAWGSFMSQPRTSAGRALLDALHYKGISRLEDGYFEDTDVTEAILAIEAEATGPKP